ncbi:MAG: RHS repeat-associated core domain-containing protein [Bacteroidales bacterium]|jgi:RHS repeat-associated protein|nr:RHS repeat-associated core domain-containing protein [Bacteroidales bacterium]
MYTSQNQGNATYRPSLQNLTLYTNGLITFTKQGYTKHYYEEGRRVSSKIGRVFGNNSDYGWYLFDTVPPINNGITYAEQQQRAEAGVLQTAECMSNVDTLSASLVIDDYLRRSLYYRFIYETTHSVAIEPVFYYLTDHLGSSSYIIDNNGNVTQAFAYMPFGEQLVDISHQNPAYSTSYKFNGKELDAESGYSYYGARYYAGNTVNTDDDSELSIWLSVDPMSDKYPHLSPYVYCANNPLKYIDPNGMDIWIHYYNGTKKTAFNYTQNRNNLPDNQFVQEVVNSLNKASEHNASADKINYFHSQDKNNIIITESSNTQLTSVKDKDEANYGIVEFNPQMGFKGGSKKKGFNITSPFILLFHEIGHLKDYYDSPEDYNNRCNSVNFIWGDDEEKFNIQNNEHPLIDFFNEQLPQEQQYYKRSTYNRDAKKVKTENSTSNKEIPCSKF